MAKTKHVKKRDGRVVPFTQERITNAIYRAAVAVGGRDRVTARNLSDQVVAMVDATFSPDKIPSVEDIQDIVEKVLIENGHAKVAKAYILYRDERNRSRLQGRSTSEQNKENIPWAKLWSVLNWAVDHGVNTVERLNKRIGNGEIQDIVMESETAYSQDINAVESAILGNRAEIKLVIIAGPSSSGKTTTTNKIALRLAEKGLTFVELNLDNYYFDLELHPKDEFGDYDFETPQALEIELINRHLKDLLVGKEIQMPYYDFKTGKRSSKTTPTRLSKNDILLIDSLYGLYPPLTEGLQDASFKVYIEPLLQLKCNDGEYVRWTDIRLMRRMLRDAAYRASDYGQTLTHWHYVRSGELRSILPYISSADYIVNSGMPYELPVYQPKLVGYFEKWAEEYKDDPLRQDAYNRASRVHALLDTIAPVTDDTVVPSDSVLREFIGGLDLGG
ncbi:MAG: ATP cone domain-containing protein [Anaerolineales bacterium]|jgi:uridine kinase